MINLAFVKSQFKIVKIPLIIFFILLFVCTIPPILLSQSPYFAPLQIINTKIINGKDVVDIQNVITGAWLFKLFFVIPSIILFFVFGLILVQQILLKEINKGYFSSWLVTPMSRKTILNSKLFVILLLILSLNISILLIQLILFKIVFKDFNNQFALHLFLYFLSLIFVSFLSTSMTWIISCYFCNKQSISISVVSGILTMFIVFYFLVEYSQIPSLDNLKYLTITSFLKPIIFSAAKDSLTLNSSQTFVFGKIKNFNLINFLWQMPTILTIGGGLFILGNWFFYKKDLHL